VVGKATLANAGNPVKLNIDRTTRRMLRNI
jgi:hypothetical protein